MQLIKSVSGIRGIFNKSLFIKDILAHTFAFSKLQSSKLPILVARDSRISGKEISESVIDYLIKNNRDVIDCDIIPTPTAQFIVDKFEIAGAIVITASHNPIDWNGMKFIDQDGTFLSPKKNKELFKIATTFNFPSNTKYDKKNISKFIESIDSHINNVCNLSFINLDQIKKRKFKIVIDTINGASCIGFKKLLEKLNCEIIHINEKPNGIFNRDPEPKTENLLDISDIVLDNSADLAFITDPDGDRLAIVDNKGEIVIEENTLVLCIEEFLMQTKSKKPIITNLSTTSAVEEVAKKYCVDVIRSAVGEINVVDEMKKYQSDIGGEGNGGVILKESHLGRDAFVASIIILNHLANQNLTMNQANNNIPKFYMLKSKVNLDNKVDSEFISKNIKSLFHTYDYNELDGIKISNDTSWAHIRKSNTEPIIRVYIESKIQKEVKVIFDKIKSVFSEN